MVGMRAPDPASPCSPGATTPAGVEVAAAAAWPSLDGAMVSPEWPDAASGGGGGRGGEAEAPSVGEEVLVAGSGRGGQLRPGYGGGRDGVR